MRRIIEKRKFVKIFEEKLLFGILLGGDDAQVDRSDVKQRVLSQRRLKFRPYALTVVRIGSIALIGWVMMQQ